MLFYIATPNSERENEPVRKVRKNKSKIRSNKRAA